MRSLSYGRIRSSCYVFASFFPFSSSLLITNLSVFPNFASQTDTFRHPQQLLIMAKEKTTKKTQTKKVSPYNKFMKEELAKVKAANPGIAHKEASFQEGCPKLEHLPREPQTQDCREISLQPMVSLLSYQRLRLDSLFSHLVL
ncbi:hypothetical protein VTP01DRAFT_10404 [Rhizomucor pusillus]|uniref:uncharacterized protein n=1 Tax=Rhizomucor pusillus TaxID=4840 RepID=UPI0037433EE7